MFTKKRDLILTFIAAVAGAIFGGLWGWTWGHPIDGLRAMHITLPTGIASGFLACFTMSIVYLRHINKKGKQFQFSLGAVFGALAGAISGAVTGAGMAFAEPYRGVGLLLATIALLMVIGAMWGGANGAIIGLLSTSFILAIPAIFRTLVYKTALPQNIAGLICYFGFWITGLLFIIIERQNKFIRFHAMQSTIAFIGLTILWISLGWVPDKISLGNIHFYDFPALLRIPVTIISGILWLILMIGANNQMKIKLPLIDKIAENYAGVE